MNFDHTSDEESGKRSGRMVSIETRSSDHLMLHITNYQMVK